MQPAIQTDSFMLQVCLQSAYLSPPSPLPVTPCIGMPEHKQPFRYARLEGVGGRRRSIKRNPNRSRSCILWAFAFMSDVKYAQREGGEEEVPRLGTQYSNWRTHIRPVVYSFIHSVSQSSVLPYCVKLCDESSSSNTLPFSGHATYRGTWRCCLFFPIPLLPFPFLLVFLYLFSLKAFLDSAWFPLLLHKKGKSINTVGQQAWLDIYTLYIHMTGYWLGPTELSFVLSNDCTLN